MNVCLLTSLLLLLSASPAVSQAELNCSESVTCLVTCQCVGAVGYQTWTVLPGDDCTVTYNTIRPRPPIGAVASICDDNHTIVYDSEGTNRFGTIVFSSSVTVVLQENVTVSCEDIFGPVTAVISVPASKFTCQLQRCS